MSSGLKPTLLFSSAPIDNALNYGAPEPSSGNGSKPEVEVGALMKGSTAEIAVTDRGPGVPVADRERVLDRFVRLEASRSEPGSGLGLSLVAAVARLHGGTLRLEDNEPGLRVVLALPVESEVVLNGSAAQVLTGAEIRPA